jgi:hypothetical protein
MVGYCERGNKPLGSMKDMEFLGQLSDLSTAHRELYTIELGNAP